MLRGLARSVDAVIAVSQFTAAQVSSPRPVVLLRPASPPPVPYEVSETESPLAIGIVGRLDPAKQHLLAIRALALTEAKLRLVIRGAAAFGDDGYVTQLTQVAAASPYDIRLEGRVAPEPQRSTTSTPCWSPTRTSRWDAPRSRPSCAGLPVIVPDAGGAARAGRGR